MAVKPIDLDDPSAGWHLEDSADQERYHSQSFDPQYRSGEQADFGADEFGREASKNFLKELMVYESKSPQKTSKVLGRLG